ncbi:hypothetical protein [Leptotrichia alba]|uniref:Uncharacterized protein n=1 Tax=Leptotrichia alba TaxID=3239304 RepID=A0AB39V8A7_9FUSO
MTPTTHKLNGELQIFPNISTLLLGVINKVNQHSDTTKLEDEDVIIDFWKKYTLMSIIYERNISFGKD